MIADSIIIPFPAKNAQPLPGICANCYKINGAMHTHIDTAAGLLYHIIRKGGHPMRYYKMDIDMDRTGDVICHSPSAPEINLYCRGQLEAPLPAGFRFTYRLQEGHVLTDWLANDKGWLLVSEAFRQQVLEAVHTEVHLLPVDVVCEDDGSTHPYYVANVLSLVDALCLAGSDYSTFQVPGRKEPFYSVRKYCLSASAVRACDLFKLTGDQVIPLFCSEKVKALCEQAGLTGIAFVEVRVEA